MRSIRIPLHSPSYPDMFATIDEEDADKVSGFRWNVRKDVYTFYARAAVRLGDRRQKTVAMHRLIMSCPDGMEVDHINLDGLDNRKENLRISHHSQNVANQYLRTSNTSGYKGVYWESRKGWWRAQIRSRGRSWVLGIFDDPILAAIAYDEAARVLHGEFARFNFPLEGERSA